MTEDYFDKTCDLHDDICETEELIVTLKELEDEQEVAARFLTINDHRCAEHLHSLATLAGNYLHIICKIVRDTSVIAQLQMVLEELKNRFENLEPVEGEFEN